MQSQSQQQRHPPHCDGLHAQGFELGEQEKEFMLDAGEGLSIVCESFRLECIDAEHWCGDIQGRAGTAYISLWATEDAGGDASLCVRMEARCGREDCDDCGGGLSAVRYDSHGSIDDIDINCDRVCFCPADEEGCRAVFVHRGERVARFEAAPLEADLMAVELTHDELGCADDTHSWRRPWQE
jgi:hypothetical protein